jgi:diguanylate cyclase (GGDEF)-like protein
LIKARDSDLNERQGISIAVLTKDEDDVELVNRTLRDSGQAAHCHWIRKPEAFDDTLRMEPLELIIVNGDKYPDSIRQVIKQKDAYLPEVPVIAVQGNVDEDHILSAMNDGACDLVSIEQTGRLQAVVSRELRAIRVERALNSTLSSATEYRKQLSDYMQGSASPMADVQEGIITQVNDAWVKLFKAKTADDVIGLPLMDSFEPASQAAVKGAVVATTKGKWQKDEKLFARSKFSGKKEAIELELRFRLVNFDQSAYVQIQITPLEKAPEEPTKLVHEALKRDPTTLFFHRAQYLDRITKRLSRKPKSGLHAIAYVKLDDFSEIRNQVGQIASEEVIALFAEEVRKRLHPRDVAGRFEGTVIMALLERGSAKDAEVWGQQLVDHLQAHEFKIDDKTIKLTCTVGVCGMSQVYANLEELISAVAIAHGKGKAGGGNCVYLENSADDDTRLRRHDAIWVKHIKSAMTDDRFRLAHLPIAGLRSDSGNMFDMLVRMMDEQGNAVLPSEFLPAAERNNLLKPIDRWIFAATVDYCAANEVDQAFVRLSRHSMQDSSLLKWIEKELGRKEIEPAKICVQIPEQEAAKYIKQTQKIADGLRTLGVAFALEHYGVDENRFQILDLLKPAYIKINGELMHSLMTDTDLQNRVRKLAAAADQRGVLTIAERVENANVMAVLFQLGVHFMQGHYVHEPEVVLQERVNVAPTTLEAIANS